MKEALSVQKELFEFSAEMNKILKENDKEKGDSWKYMPIKELLGILNSHYERLVDAIYREDEASIMDESIDTANMCMMIYTKSTT